MATYAIGDLQGCFAALERLLETIHYDRRHDHLWFVGDLVNRGPDSLSVLRLLKSLGASVTTVLGNHDLHLLAVAHDVIPARPKDTFRDVLAAPDATELVEWLRHQPLMYRTANYTMVHAGLLPQWTIEEAEGYARILEAMLTSPRYRDLLRSLYDQTIPNAWSSDLESSRQVVVAARALTRLRICSMNGRMDLAFSRTPAEVPAGYYPWFRVPGRRSADTTVICGHWAALGLLMEERVIALDSGCVWGAALTAIRLEDRRIFQVRCTGLQ